jgi:KRAB domain-containing zinc finger protein
LKHFRNHIKVKFTSKESENEIQDSDDKEKQQINESSAQIICRICSKEISSKPSLKQHLVVQSAEKNFPCLECGKNFKTIHYLKSNLLINQSEGTHVCILCAKGFKWKNNVNTHIKTHYKI